MRAFRRGDLEELMLPSARQRAHRRAEPCSRAQRLIFVRRGAAEPPRRLLRTAYRDSPGLSYHAAMGQISSAPVELIRVQRGGGASWRGAVAEMQGWRADHEDAHFMRNGGGPAYDLFGVLDGHGGSEAARLAAHQKLPELLQAACGGAAKAFGELEKRVAAAFVETDAWLRARPEVLRDQSGSTCVVGGVKKLGDNAYGAFLANAGDSRGLVVRRAARAAAAASDDHKPDRDDEMRRIADAGGFVSDADAARRVELKSSTRLQCESN